MGTGRGAACVGRGIREDRRLMRGIRHRNPAGWALWVAVAALWLAGPIASAASFQGLGDLPGGSFWSVAGDVTPDGTVVVGQGTSASGIEPFRWTQAGGMVGLGQLAGCFTTTAGSVSADGTVVVGAGRSASRLEAFRWTQAGGMVGLGDLPGGAFNSAARRVSDDGTVVVGWCESASGLDAFRWTQAGGMVALGDLPGGGYESSAWDCSADGSVVVGLCRSASGREAFRWTEAGGMVGLGELPGGGFDSLAYAVSADGSVVVGQDTSASALGREEAFRWTQAGGMVGLGGLPGGGTRSSAWDVSADGSVVVGVGYYGSDDQAFIWTAATGMRSLKTVLVNDYGLNLTGWRLHNAFGISPDGKVIVGYGTNPSGRTEAWIANLRSANRVPIANAGPDQTVEQASAAGTQVTLDGSGSSDPDGNPLTYRWTWPGGSATGVKPTVTLPLGATTVTLIVNDGQADSAPDTVLITVRDTTPPVIEGGWAAPGGGWSDGFEGPSLESGGWTILQQNLGLISLSTDVSHSGQQSAKFTPYNGGQKGLDLAHRLGPLPQEGTLSAWFYDGGYGMYVHLQATKGAGFDYVANVGVQDWDGSYYHATGGTHDAEGGTAVPRSIGWHHFEIAGTAVGVTITIDGIVAATAAGDYRFDGVRLDLEGPHYSGPSYYFDDVSFTPVSGPVPADVTVEQTSRDGTPVNLSAPTVSDLCDANPTVTNNAPAVFPLGTTVVTWTATDHSGNVATTTRTVTVVDTTPPTLVVPADITVEQATAAGTVVNFTCTATDVCDAQVDIVCNPPSGTVFPLGVTTVTCTATDDSGNQTVKSFTVTVKDTTPPAIESAWATPDVLWPANHKMVDIAIGAVVTDICDAAPAWKIVGVASNEPVNGLGDGDTAPDWEFSGQSLKLRAERSGKAPGRVYTITLQATDASGNRSTASCTVSVPHDKKK